MVSRRRETLDEMRARMLREHAGAVGQPEAEVRESLASAAGSFAADAREADRQGITLDELRQADQAALVAFQYPTPECLDVGDIAAYARGEELEPVLIAHVVECEFCSGLLTVGVPSVEREEAFAASVDIEQARLRLLKRGLDQKKKSVLVVAAHDDDESYELLAAAGSRPAASARSADVSPQAVQSPRRTSKAK